MKFNIKLPASSKAATSKGTVDNAQEPAENRKPADKVNQTEDKSPLNPKSTARIKDDASLVSALKQAEKTIAKKANSNEKAVDPTAVVKRKARIMSDPEEAKPAPVPEAPKVEERKPEPEIVPEVKAVEAPKVAPVVEVKAAPVVAKAPEIRPAVARPATTTSSYVPPRPMGSGAPSARKDLKAPKPKEVTRFDGRDQKGLGDSDNQGWRKRRQFKPAKKNYADETVRPKSLNIRLPITVKDLAMEMKLKASQLIPKLFAQGQLMTLNDFLEETAIQLLGLEFGCEIIIDTKEEDRLRITDLSIRQEIDKTKGSELQLRPPIVTFMGHVDHGKTSLIDSIRKSNRVAHEAGAITQHIGAFKVKTASGNVTILDTPGHEAFSAMRSRGANVTDIVILVIAGDEGIRTQTDEAIKQARDASVPIIVALNKCDRPNFDAEKVYRELSDRDLLPEAWGGTTITVNCSAASGEGIKELLEMIALQAEILELRANPDSRARGTVLESQMVKGLGAVATIIVLNGTLKKNDAIVFGSEFGRIKTMQDDDGKSIVEAGPGSPVKITGLSDLALAGSEFIVVKNEKEAKDLAAARAEGALRSDQAKAKLSSLERMMAKKAGGEFKILPVILCADAKGSLEALHSLLKTIKSTKVRIEFVHESVGEITEADIERAEASKAVIVAFHTKKMESRAADLLKRKNIPLITEDVIFKAVDLVKERMTELLDTIPEERNLGQAEVLQIFKASKIGILAGCMVKEGVMKRHCLVRQYRGKDIIWKGKIESLKKEKDDAKEVKEGFHCGILLQGQNDIEPGDIIEAYEIHHLKQEL